MTDASNPAQNRENILKQPHASLWFAERAKSEEADRPLPSPTRDLDTLKGDLDVHGYCLIADSLTKSEIAQMRLRVHEQMDAEEPLNAALPSPTGRRNTSNLLNKGKIFQTTLTNDLVNATVEHLLGEDFLLSAISCIQSIPGSLPQGLHFDQARMGLHLPTPLVANSVFMLDDFTEANGATRVVPGSHSWSAEEIERNFTPSQSALSENSTITIAAEAPAGTCLVFEGRLLHGTGKNVTRDQTRAGVFAYYCRPWVRQLENPYLSISDDVMASFPLEIRLRLGYRPWNAFGGYQGPGIQPPLDVIRPTNQIRELRPKIA